MNSDVAEGDVDNSLGCSLAEPQVRFKEFAFDPEGVAHRCIRWLPFREQNADPQYSWGSAKPPPQAIIFVAFSDALYSFTALCYYHRFRRLLHSLANKKARVRRLVVGDVLPGDR